MAALGGVLVAVLVLLSFYVSVGLLQGYVRGTTEGKPLYSDLLPRSWQRVLRNLGFSALALLVTGMIVFPLLSLVGVLAVVNSPLASPIGVFSVYLAALIFIVVAATLLGLTSIAIIDSNATVLESMFISIRVVGKNFFRFLGFLFIVGLIFAVPSFITGLFSTPDNTISPAVAAAFAVLYVVLIVVVMPTIYIAYTLMYREGIESNASGYVTVDSLEQAPVAVDTDVEAGATDTGVADSEADNDEVVVVRDTDNKHVTDDPSK